MPARLNGTTSGYTELAAADAPANNTIVLPANNGSAYQVLRNGATPGLLEFATLSSNPSFEIFTSSNTWTCPAGANAAIVGVVGGGGGGGGGGGAPGAGGHGGLGIGLVSVTPGTTYTVTVGTGGISTFNSAGTAGGTSSFGPQGQPALISATGGGGGTSLAGTNGSCSSTAANLRRTNATVAAIPYVGGVSPKSDGSGAAAVWSISSAFLPGAGGAVSCGAVGGMVFIQCWS